MIAEHIYNYCGSLKHDRVLDDEITFAPSYFKDCSRKIFWRKKGEPESDPISSAALLKMELGTAAHEKLQDIFRKIGIWVEGEDNKEIIKDGLRFFYRIDGRLKIADKEMLCEIKTIYGAGFYAVEKAPKPDHVLQCALYMEFEQQALGVLLYVGRDNGRMLEHYIQRDATESGTTWRLNGIPAAWIGDSIRKGIDRLKWLKTKIDVGELPGRDFSAAMKNFGDYISWEFARDGVKHKTDWQCSYCAYKMKCWSEVLEKIKSKKFYIKGEYYE